MKKMIVILGLVINFVTSYGQQKEGVSVRLGFLFNPQGSISLRDAKNGSKLLAPLLLTGVINFKENTFLPHYNLTANAFGLIYSRALDGVEVYAFANKFVLAQGGYASIGVTKKMGPGSGFIEVGSTWNAWNPAINVGVIIPLTFKIK